MCYDVETVQLRKIKDGIRRGFPADEVNELIDDYNTRFNPVFPHPRVYHVSGFSHPEVSVLHMKNGSLALEPMKWGLIPFWSKDIKSATSFWNKTLNARSETIFEKPSFKAAARKRRGAIVLDSFFEHHHFKSKTYPFNIRRKDGEPLVLATLWEEWTDKSTGEIWKTFTIVTTEGNELLAGIHNNPKLSGPRMPVILEDDDIPKWLGTPEADDNHLELLPLCKPLRSEELLAYPVRPLRGKNAVGNVPEAIERFEYEELVEDKELMKVLSV